MDPTPPTVPLRRPRRADERIAWRLSVPFLAVHVVALAAPFLVPPTWPLAALAAASYLLRMFGVTAGLHRYFSHRSYRTGRVFQFLLALLATTAVQKGVLWWSAHHRHHHRHSDGPEDIHSPLVRGFWWSHVGWFLCTRYDETPLEQVRDLARYPELRWLDRNERWVVVGFATVLFLAGGWGALLWGFFVPTVLLWHATFTVNSLTHVAGTRRYATPDGSRNNWFVALLTLGEGWHNNHHHYQSSTNQGWFWWEFDPTWYALRVLAAVGVVRDLRRPPEPIRLGLEEPGDLARAA